MDRIHQRRSQEGDPHLACTCFSSLTPFSLRTAPDPVRILQGNAKTTSNAQIVQKWKWLPADFSEKAGELTPTLKLKRNVVTAKYQDLIEAIYAEAGDDK